MEPLLKIDDAFTVNPFAYTSNPIERFDVVIYEMPELQKKRFNISGSSRLVKRVIGMPGEKIEIRNNKIYINDKLLEEPFEKIIDEDDFRKDFPPKNIPQNEYFLLGDNRPNSEDSRYYSPATIKKQDIYSKLLEVYPGYYKNR